MSDCLTIGFLFVYFQWAKVTTRIIALILIEVEMPREGDVCAQTIVKERYPDLNVLMQTQVRDVQLANVTYSRVDASTPGNTEQENLLEAIISAFYAGMPNPPVIARPDLRSANAQSRTIVASDEFALTPRETEILHLMVGGLSYKMIAADRHISYETARSHIKNIYAKLQVATMSEAVVKAVRSRLF